MVENHKNQDKSRSKEWMIGKTNWKSQVPAADIYHYICDSKSTPRVVPAMRENLFECKTEWEKNSDNKTEHRL